VGNEVEGSSAIVDAQVHLNLLGTVESAVAVMDAVGVQSVLIDEWWGYDSDGIRLPHVRLANGAARHMYPFVSDAALRYPERFAYTAWVDPGDPALDFVVAEVADNPHQVAVRIVLRPDLNEDTAIERGRYDRLLDLAANYRIPVKLIVASADVRSPDIARKVSVLKRVIEQNPRVHFVVDHCTVLWLSPRDVERGERRPSALEHALALASLPNAVLLWCHAPTLSHEAFPYRDLFPYLRLLIDGFGASRIMWGSDATHAIGHHNWAEALYCVRTCDVVNDYEREMLLGGTARRVFRWPAPGIVSKDYLASTWRSMPIQVDRSALHDRRRR
jgi:L-fuconolactonase